MVGYIAFGKTNSNTTKQPYKDLFFNSIKIYFHLSCNIRLVKCYISYLSSAKPKMKRVIMFTTKNNKENTDRVQMHLITVVVEKVAIVKTNK